MGIHASIKACVDVAQTIGLVSSHYCPWGLNIVPSYVLRFVTLALTPVIKGF